MILGRVRPRQLPGPRPTAPEELETDNHAVSRVAVWLNPALGVGLLAETAVWQSTQTTRELL